MAKPKMNPLLFLRQVRQEGRKVTWTGRQEVIVTTLFVLAFVALMAVLFRVIDFLAARTVCTVLTLDVIECWLPSPGNNS